MDREQFPYQEALIPVVKSQPYCVQSNAGDAVMGKVDDKVDGYTMIMMMMMMMMMLMMMIMMSNVDS